MGHDGPGHVAIADERPVLRALKLYHGKSGAGLSVEFKVRLGPVTILGVSQTADGRLKLLAAEGESIAGPDVPDRQHELAHPLRARARPRSWTPGAPRGRRTTSRSASATSSGASARSPTCSGSSSRSSNDGCPLPRPGHGRVRRERRASRGRVRGADRHRARRSGSSRATSTTRTGSTTCSTATSAADVYMSGPGARLGAPRERVRRAARRPARAARATATTPPTSSSRCSHCNRWSGRFGDPLGEGPLLEIPVNCESYNLAYVPAVLERAGRRGAADVGASTSPRRGRSSSGRAATSAASPSAAPTPGTRCTRASRRSSGRAAARTSWTVAARSPRPSRSRRDRATSSPRSATPARPTGSSSAGTSSRSTSRSGRYGLIVDSDHYVATSRSPRRRALAGEIAYALPPLGPTGERRPNLWTWSVVMNTRARDRDEAWRFVEWATGARVPAPLGVRGEHEPDPREHLGRRALPRAHAPAGARSTTSRGR